MRPKRVEGKVLTTVAIQADQEPLHKMLTESGFAKVYEFLGMEQQV